MKKTLIAISVASLLTACGGSPSSENAVISDTGSANIRSTEYRVIDGYLNNADVCLIAETETECKEMGKTDENGLIILPAGTESGQLVATIVAGQTSDADSVGYVAQTYQMIANIDEDSQNVITPYTTLDALDSNKTIDDIAAELGLSVDLIKGDYVASNHEQKIQVHSIARTLATQLAEKKQDNDSTELFNKITAINDYINITLGNTDVDLSEQNIVIAKDGTISHEKAINGLADFLESGPLYFQSLNTYIFNQESVRSIIFNEGQTTFTNDDDTVTITDSYEISGNTLTLGNRETDEFIYVSNELSLSVPLDRYQDLILISNSDSYEKITDWTSTELIGNTFYLVSDDAGTNNSTPDPLLITIKFNEDSVIISEKNSDDIEVRWSIEDGRLTIYASDETDRDFIFSKSVADKNITMISDSGKQDVALTAMFKDKNLATSIYNRWVILAN